MSPYTAGLLLAWVAIVILAFALAGTIAQVRALRHASLTTVLPRPMDRRPRDLAPVLSPAGPSLVLVVTPECQICAQTVPRFVELMSGVDIPRPYVLTSNAHTYESSDGIAIVVDPGVFAALYPGWAPALVLLDTAGQIVMSEPVGSTDALERCVAEAITRMTRVSGGT